MDSSRRFGLLKCRLVKFYEAKSPFWVEISIFIKIKIALSEILFVIISITSNRGF